jgi:hypothetical protein
MNPIEPHYKCDRCNTKVHSHQVKVINNRMWGCKSCYDKSDQKQKKLESVRKWKRNNRDKTKNGYLVWKFGITKEQYDIMLQEHQEGCAVCRQPCQTGRQLGVDHNHKTGMNRGLLCYKCNLALGYLNEDENLIWNLLEYMKKYNIKVA